MIRNLVVVGSISLAAVLAVGCHSTPGDAPKTDNSKPVAAAPSGDIPKTQSAQRDPCSWISRADAEKALGETLLHAPTRVRAADNTDSSPSGAACLYEISSTDPIKKIVSIEIALDESGAMQAAFMGMGNVEKEFKGSETKGDTLIGGRWDFVSGIPGGLTAAKAGRISVQVFSSTGTDQGMALASAIVDRIPDLPFTNDPADPTAPPHDPDPCKLITRAEAEAVLGPLVVAPYRSVKSTALAHGDGQSCSYFTGKHRALVVTPKYRGGADLFRMLGGVNTMVAGTLGSVATPDTAAGNWDKISTGIDGTMHVLKGDKMLSLQYKSSAADYEKAVKLAGAAIVRLQ